MNKKFARIIFGFAVAFAMLIPMFSQTASAQVSGSGSGDVIFVTNFNQRIQLLNEIFGTANLQLGPSRVMFITGTLLGINGEQLTLEAQTFGVPLETMVVATIISRETGLSTSRILLSLQNGVSPGELVFNLGLPRSATMLRINSFIDVFANEVGVSTGGSNTSDETFLEVLTRLFAMIDSRFDVLNVRLGNVTFEAIILLRLSAETGAPVDLLAEIRNKFLNTDIDDFALGILLANTINPDVAARLGFVLEDVSVITPLGVAREIGPFGIPIQVFAARVDVFQRLVRFDANTGNTPGTTEG
jgi:hypothetical protein